MKNKKFFIGLLVGVSLSLVTPAFANSGSLTTQITQLKKQVSSLKSENAKLKKSVPTFKTGTIYQDGVAHGSAKFLTTGGKNYAEINSMASALTGYTNGNINFEKNNLYLGVKPVKGTIQLTKIPVYKQEGGNIKADYKTTINNKTVFSGIGTDVFLSSKPSITYKVDKRYRELQGKFGIEDKNPSSLSKKAYFKVYGDDTLIYTSEEANYLDDPIDVKVDIKGYKYIKIEFLPSTPDSIYRVSPMLVNPVLLP